MTWLAKVVEHSQAPNGKNLISFQLSYPRFIHAEAKTHRVLSNSGVEYEQTILTQDAGFMSDKDLSRNASSSRAIPVEKMIEQVRNNPAVPVHWGKNQPGMQARVELEGDDRDMVERQWRIAAERAADSAAIMMALGAHKQVANRILEPFQWINVIVSATEWDNFYALRDHPDADPNICHLAQLMRKALDSSKPRQLGDNPWIATGWHLPYITAEERAEHELRPLYLAQLSTARNARVSYLTHDGANPDAAKDLLLFNRLVGSEPLHASPTEHPACALPSARDRSKNFFGFHQYRSMVEAEINLQQAA